MVALSFQTADPSIPTMFNFGDSAYSVSEYGGFVVLVWDFIYAAHIFYILLFSVAS